jgi:hypothetical protein
MEKGKRSFKNKAGESILQIPADHDDLRPCCHKKYTGRTESSRQIIMKISLVKFNSIDIHCSRLFDLNFTFVNVIVMLLKIPAVRIRMKYFSVSCFVSS